MLFSQDSETVQLERRQRRNHQGNLRGRSGPDTWVDGRGGRGLARKVSAGGREHLAESSTGRRIPKDEPIKKLKRPVEPGTVMPLILCMIGC